MNHRNLPTRIEALSLDAPSAPPVVVDADAAADAAIVQPTVPTVPTAAPISPIDPTPTAAAVPHSEPADAAVVVDGGSEDAQQAQSPTVEASDAPSLLDATPEASNGRQVEMRKVGFNEDEVQFLSRSKQFPRVTIGDKVFSVDASGLIHIGRRSPIEIAPSDRDMEVARAIVADCEKGNCFQMSVYLLKHCFESKHGYTGPGSLIVALAEAGFELRYVRGDLIPFVGLNLKFFRRIDREYTGA